MAISEAGGVDEAAFSRVYSKKLWGTGGGGSGSGSSLEATQSISALLVHLAVTLNVTSMLDVPCGAMVWMPHVLNAIDTVRAIDGLDGRTPAASTTLGRFRYVGADVVPSVVAANKRRFARKTRLRFEHADFTRSAFVRQVGGPFDLVLSRAVFYHLSSHSILRALRHLKATNSTWLLANTHDVAENTDTAMWRAGGTQELDAGGYRRVNLLLPPYNLPPPLWRMLDTGGSPSAANSQTPQMLGLWRLRDLPV